MKKSPKRGTPTHLAFHCVDELVLTTCNGKRHLESSPFLLCRKGSTAMAGRSFKHACVVVRVTPRFRMFSESAEFTLSSL